MYIIKKVQKYINHKNKEIVKKQAYRFLTTLNTKFIPKTILKKIVPQIHKKIQYYFQ